MRDPSTIRVLAIASAGGHWVQLMRLRPAWDGVNVIYVSTAENRCREITQEARIKGQQPPSCYTVIDATRWDKFKLLKQFLQITFILIKERPTVVISTGAAPGFFALRIGKWMGIRTVWLDSMANADKLSLSGEKASCCADLWLTQWKDLAGDGTSTEKQPQYKGAVV